MTRDSRLRSRFGRGAALIALAVCAAAPAVAQEVAPAATPNADRLAEEMRTLAREPRNVRALLSAGELSARLNDPAAAAGFFARAQAIDPSNPRVLAGQAMVMVRQERPGEALRLFAEAERRGLSMAAYASDRGLAYDLTGAQGHAQREYRIAMRDADDETIRRYALSLGISGQDEQAMRVLDPLLRRSDRAGWRARAFILAMNGDAAGADKIAGSMMGGVGSALAPFFRRLPSLSPSDKAFAVHFGELRRTTARIADAQLAPPLPRLGQEPGVALAAADLPRHAAPAPAEVKPEPRPAGRRSASGRRGERQSLAWQANEQAEARRAAEARQAQATEAKRLADLKAQQERDALAAKQREADRIAAEQLAAREAEARRVAEIQQRERIAAELAEREAVAKRFAEAQRLADSQRAAAQPVVTPAEPATQPPAPQMPAPAPVVAASAATPGAPAPAPAETPAVRTAEASPPAPRIGGEDNVIARIIAGITIPASELGIAPMPGRAEPEPPAAAPVPQPAPVEVAKVEAPKPRPAAERAKPEPAKAKPEPAKPEPKTARGKASDAKAADPKTAKEAKGKAAAKEKAKPDPAKSEPARHWVQVAGGANVGDLPKAWRALVAKAPAELKGRQPWTTPLRFTNRLLVGPFKSAAEAQAFVNTIGKKGLSAFAWTSDAGQKIEKLGLK